MCCSPCPGRLALPWPRAQCLSRSPAGMLTTCRRGLTGLERWPRSSQTGLDPLPLPRAPGCSPEATLSLPFCPGNPRLQGSCPFRFPRVVLNYLGSSPMHPLIRTGSGARGWITLADPPGREDFVLTPGGSSPWVFVPNLPFFTGMRLGSAWLLQTHRDSVAFSRSPKGTLSSRDPPEGGGLGLTSPPYSLGIFLPRAQPWLLLGSARQQPRLLAPCCANQLHSRLCRVSLGNNPQGAKCSYN